MFLPARPLMYCLLFLCALHLPAPARASDDAVVREDIAVVNNSNEDAGFNQLVSEGVHSFETQKRVKVRVISRPGGELFEPDELELAVITAIGEGLTSILVAGPTYQTVLLRLSQRHPKLRIVIVDGNDDLPGNVQTVQFRSHEAAYLAGIVAARASSTGIIGFVGGIDDSGIRAFGCAYAQGARSARADLNVRGRLLENKRIAFGDPEGGRRMARALLDERADVIFAAAGGSGLGVLDETAKAGAYAIGVDANQNGLHPGRILTSVLKRMDVSVYTSLLALNEGRWQRGLQNVGLSEGAVGLAMDEHNRNLVSRETRAELEAVEFAIRSGEIEVIDARVDAAGCDELITYTAGMIGGAQ